MRKILISILEVLIIIFIISCKKPNEKVLETGTVSDFEENNYPTIKIGSQWWMAENLRATKYNNGELIGTTAVGKSIIGESLPKYQWAYLGNVGLALIYGRMYTWYAVTDPRSVCPTGWHLPADYEWTILTDYLISNGYGYEGSGDDIGKSLAASIGWLLYGKLGTLGKDQETNNSTGFSALPTGIRQSDGYCLWAGADVYYWSSTESSPSQAYHRLLDYWYDNVRKGTYDKNTGLSVRCIKDNP